MQSTSTPEGGDNQRHFWHLKSLIGHRDFFWIRDRRTGIWILGRTERFKNGRPKSGWIDEKHIVQLAPEPTDEMLLAVMRQAENDLLFHLASGDRPGPVKSKTSIRRDLDASLRRARGADNP